MYSEFALAFDGSDELRRPKLLQSRCSPKLTIAKVGEVGYAVLHAVLQGCRRGYTKRRVELEAGMVIAELAKSVSVTLLLVKRSAKGITWIGPEILS